MSAILCRCGEWAYYEHEDGTPSVTRVVWWINALCTPQLGGTPRHGHDS